MAKPHRGRIQAQSDRIEESVAWSQDEPPTLEQGLDMVDQLKEKLSKKELGKREEQFNHLGRFMKNAQNQEVFIAHNSVLLKTKIIKTVQGLILNFGQGRLD